MQQVVLVNEDDVELGTMEKMETHRKGLLHRAFSIFIFDQYGRMLLQQRSADKYHGALLWSNACCSHPFPGEKIEDAAQRRLMEELGFQAPLQKIFTFLYRAEVENGLIEHEMDHVFTGEYQGRIRINPKEVSAYEYASMEWLRKKLQTDPGLFTTWLRIAFPRVEEWWSENYPSEDKI